MIAPKAPARCHQWPRRCKTTCSHGWYRPPSRCWWWPAARHAAPANSSSCSCPSWRSSSAMPRRCDRSTSPTTQASPRSTPPRRRPPCCCSIAVPAWHGARCAGGRLHRRGRSRRCPPPGSGRPAAACRCRAQAPHRPGFLAQLAALDRARQAQQIDAAGRQAAADALRTATGAARMRMEAAMEAAEPVLLAAIEAARAGYAAADRATVAASRGSGP